MDIRTRVGLRIKAMRRAKRLTQEQLAAMIDRSVDAISNIERGISLAGYDSLERIAEGLGVRVVDLFDDEHETDPARINLFARARAATAAMDDHTLDKAVAILEILADTETGPRT